MRRWALLELDCLNNRKRIPVGSDWRLSAVAKVGGKHVLHEQPDEQGTGQRHQQLRSLLPLLLEGGSGQQATRQRSV